MRLVNSSCPGQLSTNASPSSRACASTGARSWDSAAFRASAAVPYGLSARRVDTVGGIISSSPRSYPSAASPGSIHTVRSASVEALRVRWPSGSAATKNQVS